MRGPALVEVLRRTMLGEAMPSSGNERSVVVGVTSATV